MDTFHRRDNLLRSIEWILLDVVSQIAMHPPPSRLFLRSSDDASCHHISYNKKTARKLAYNIKTLAQVYQLLLCNQRSSLRDLYYDEKKLYVRQETLNRSVTAICELLSVTRDELHVVSCSKGLLAGSLSFLSPSSASPVLQCVSAPLLITESLLFLHPSTSAKFILVVEKDACFQKLVDDGFFALHPDSILATGKGYPDLCTRRVIRWLSERLSLPVFGLFDADPHGIQIYLTYKYGSIKESAEGVGAAVPRMQWLGLRPSDHLILPLAAHHMLAMKSTDYAQANRIRKRATSLKEHDIVREIDYLRERRSKMELEAVSSAGVAYLPRLYLAPRLRYLLENAV